LFPQAPHGKAELPGWPAAVRNAASRLHRFCAATASIAMSMVVRDPMAALRFSCTSCKCTTLSARLRGGGRPPPVTVCEPTLERPDVLVMLLPTSLEGPGCGWRQPDWVRQPDVTPRADCNCPGSPLRHYAPGPS